MAPWDRTHQPVSVVVTTEVPTDKHAAFAEWQDRMNHATSRFPGYAGHQVVPPSEGNPNIWTSMFRFETSKDLERWMSSPEREHIHKDLLELRMAPEEVNVFKGKAPEQVSKTEAVSLAWRFNVKRRKSRAFKKLLQDLGQAAAGADGFHGIDVQEPALPNRSTWAVFTRWNSQSDKEEWENSQTCQRLLARLSELAEFRPLGTLPTGLSGWLNFDASTSGRSAPIWKQAMLILLVLYPTVSLLTIYTANVFQSFPLWKSLFIGNLASVIVLSWLLMPFAAWVFRWWLYPAPRLGRWVQYVGILIIVCLYALEMTLFALVWFPTWDSS
jgi:antibiotic biosynthesis monooxygenase (ABM) superfamily enzyme